MTIGTRNKIHLLHRNDKRAPPGQDYLKQGTWKLTQKILFSVYYGAVFDGQELDLQTLFQRL